MIKLGVNIDHIATIRQARKGLEPNPLEAAFLAEKGGAHIITVHLREDLRHIQHKDVIALKEHSILPLNLEMALNNEVLDFALKIKPYSVTIVPEKREELTTEGGLDVSKHIDKIKQFIEKLNKIDVIVSLFIDPNEFEVKAAYDSGANAIELHTGDYANNLSNRTVELEKLKKASELANSFGLELHAGHGLNYSNILPIIALPKLVSVNIGHSIVSRAVMVGMEKAVNDMVVLLK